MGSRHGHTTSAITRGEPRLARGERILAVLAALGALLPLVVMPATVLIYQPLFRQAFTDTPDVHEKLAAVDQIMYAGLYVSLAASFLALICCLGAVAGHGSTGASEPTFPWRMRVLAIALPLASIELTALLVWLVGFQGTVEWRWG